MRNVCLKLQLALFTRYIFLILTKIIVLSKGIVIKSTGSWYTVKTENDQIIECKIKGTFRTRDLRSTNPVSVGDFVEIEIVESSTGIITNIRERNNYIIRRSPNLSKEYQIIASNIDQAFLIVTISHPATTTTFIDRFLASAEAYRIPCHLVFNKTDLYNSSEVEQLKNLINIYTSIGYTCIESSAVKNTGIEIIRSMMKDKTSVFSGHSGVGKSTLINKIESTLDLKTSQLSEYHDAGKHTTTFSEMFELSFGGYIIDTPGIKGFGVLDMDKAEITHYFPEMFLLLEKCQYANCTHTHEPGCEVKRAVSENEIALSRYSSYLGLLEKDEKYRT